MKNILNFLTGLKDNNNKDWFEANRKEYTAAKTEFELLVTELIRGIAVFDPEIGDLEAKKCVFRINRDVRFSPDKSPYKSNFGASFSVGGKKSPSAGYYIHVQPGASFVGGGIYMPEPNILKAVRQEIDYNLEEFETILNGSDFKAYYGGISDEGKLSRPPKGYEQDNPANEYLKNKHFIVLRDYSDADVSKSNFKEDVIRGFKLIKPFNDFLNRSIEEVK